ncbi:MAG: DUF479 domain-containing protein [Proteobacteria bacterium]|nr:DUF479 domain-containing protein [Pseudomonadota bacterium]
MNHFAHLVLSQPTVESAVGNLLGDFARGLDLATLPPSVKAGLQNHRAVDSYTDRHPLITDLKSRFSSQRRRFAGIALDIYFDHLLINFWDNFEAGTPEQAATVFYQRLSTGQSMMPGEEMRLVTKRIIQYDWFSCYREIESIAESLDRVAGRIRFANSFDNAIEDLQRNENEIRETFFEFYPQLKAHIRTLAIER